MSLEIENFGISDEALDNFREFMEMTTAVELPMYLSLDLQCPVCLSRSALQAPLNRAMWSHFL